jgi:hypothetical protein
MEPAPAGFEHVCPECGKWKNDKGIPYTPGALNFHRVNAHGYRSNRPAAIKKREGKQPAEQPSPMPATAPHVRAPHAPKPVSTSPELQDDNPEMAQASQELDYETFANVTRRNNLIRSLNANNLLKKVAKQYILNNWDLNPQIKSDARQLFDFLMRIPELVKNTAWARDIVDITFSEEDITPPPPSPYYEPRGGYGYRQQQSGYGAPRQPGYGGQSPYGRDRYGGGYDQRYESPYPPQQPTNPRDQGFMAPWEVEERNRQERERWDATQEIRELRRANDELNQRMANPPPPPVDPQAIVNQTLAKLMPTGPNEDTLAMREEIRLMREEQSRLRAENERAKTEISVQNAVSPLVREVQDMRAGQMARAAEERVRQQTASRYEHEIASMPRERGLNDTATVAIEEIKNQTTQFTTMAGNLNNTMNNFINAVTRLISPGAPTGVNTQGMTEAEKAELDRAARGG